jgi:hypothetical protein
MRFRFMMVFWVFIIICQAMAQPKIHANKDVRYYYESKQS